MNDDELPPVEHHPQRRECGRVSFIAVMDEVRADVVRGVPLVQIYEAFEDRLDLGYTSSPNTLLGSSSIGRPVICIAFDHRLHRLDQCTS